jgi:hypothetical protein
MEMAVDMRDFIRREIHCQLKKRAGKTLEIESDANLSSAKITGVT